MYARGSAAERLVEAYLTWAGYSEIHVARAARERTADGKFFTRSHDLFGAFDVLAADDNMSPEVWALQVTTPSNISDRKKKIERRPWPREWRICVCVVYREAKDATISMRVLHRSKGLTTWSPPEDVKFDVPTVMAALAFAEAAKKSEKRKRKPSLLDGAAAEAKKRKG